MRCPKCNQRIVQKQAEATQIRTKGRLLLKSDGAHTQCFWCGADVVLPLKLVEPAVKPGTKLILRKAEKEKTILDTGNSSG